MLLSLRTLSTAILHLPVSPPLLFTFISSLSLHLLQSLFLFSLPLSLLDSLYLYHRTLEILTRHAQPTQQKALVEAFLRNHEDVNIHYMPFSHVFTCSCSLLLFYLFLPSSTLSKMFAYNIIYCAMRYYFDTTIYTEATFSRLSLSFSLTHTHTLSLSSLPGPLYTLCPSSHSPQYNAQREDTH